MTATTNNINSIIGNVTHLPLPLPPTHTMIRDNRLTYLSSSSLWYESEFSSPTLNAVAIAAAMTLISYQTTAIIFDLILGFKGKWVSTVSRLHILLITRKATPLVVSNNLLRRDWLTALYYRGDIPPGVAIARERERIRFATALVLLFLLAVAPLINIVSIVLTLEREHTRTFAESGFGGAAFGVKPGLDITEEERLTELCVRLPVLSAPGDTPLAEFSLCKLPWTGRQEGGGTQGLVSISIADAHQVLISVQIGSYSVELYKTAHLYANGTSWVIKPDLSPASVAELVDLGMGLVSEECGVADDVEPVDTYVEFIEPQRENIMAKRVPCDVDEDTRDKCARILSRIERHITLIDADILEVASKPVELAAAVFFKGSQMEFIRRRRLYVGVAVLWVIAGITAVLRIMTALFWNNDVGDGIERIVKEQLGLGCCSSLLKADDRTIAYNRKYQSGKLGHYGVGKEDWPVVSHFEGATIGTFSLSRGIEGESESDFDSSFAGPQIYTNV